MGYKPPQPTIQAFKDPSEKDWARHVYERLDNIENATNLQSYSSGRKAPPPPQAKLAVTTNNNVTGHAYVRITLPQFLTNSKQNAIAAPILHSMQASPFPSFDKQVTDFGISGHNYYDISELGSGTFYFQLKSTFDGKTFNNPVRSQKVVIP